MCIHASFPHLTANPLKAVGTVTGEGGRVVGVETRASTETRVGVARVDVVLTVRSCVARLTVTEEAVLLVYTHTTV